MLNICEGNNHLAVMPCKWMDRLACAECNEEHPTNIDGNCSEIFHRPVQWRCQGHRKDKTNLSTQASKSLDQRGLSSNGFIPAEIICFHVTLQKFQNEWFGEMVQSLKKTAMQFNQTHLENSQAYYHNKPTQQRFYQVKWLVFSNPMQDPHHPWASSHWPTSVSLGPTSKFLKYFHFPSKFLVW